MTGNLCPSMMNVGNDMVRLCGAGEERGVVEERDFEAAKRAVGLTSRRLGRLGGGRSQTERRKGRKEREPAFSSLFLP